VMRAVRTLANKNFGPEGLADHLSQTILAIRQKDKSALRRFAGSELATQRTKTLIADLLREPEDRNIWSFAQRNLRSALDLNRFGRYGQLDPAYRALARLLDIGAKSSDWQRLVEPRIAAVRQKWTTDPQARMLINAWVLRLQASVFPKFSQCRHCRRAVHRHTS
jgi:hypothetical protein